ncbi:hypothetical protein AVEN_174297-1 [Araneus ventricosus]|uniref:DUF4817 domain-containing protein n=1 Tax=Araneus ventricosus TaxID=182803 RepID=A0A4Y2N845_ARAVE|nr:hypothetical protein AVEN_174297-1 [Araneus ventricosus]
MQLAKEEQINIILLAGSSSTRHVERTFTSTHKEQITHNTTVVKLIIKFERIGFVKDTSRSGRSGTATVEGATAQVSSVMARSPTKGTRRLSAQMGIGQNSAMRILWTSKWRSYKLQML